MAARVRSTAATRAFVRQVPDIVKTKPTPSPAAHAIDTAGRVGDVTLGMKANLLHPDGSGLSIALQPFVSVPVGRAPVGAGNWGTGVVVPVTYDLSTTLNLATTSEIDAAVDADGSGRHLAFSEVIGLGVKLSKVLTVTVEGAVLRDEDPSGKTTQDLASASLAWAAKDDLQVDLGAVAGLNRAAPDVELYFGVSRRFYAMTACRKMVGKAEDWWLSPFITRSKISLSL